MPGWRIRADAAAQRRRPRQPGRRGFVWSGRRRGGRLVGAGPLGAGALRDGGGGGRLRLGRSRPPLRAGVARGDGRQVLVPRHRGEAAARDCRGDDPRLRAPAVAGQRPQARRHGRRLRDRGRPRRAWRRRATPSSGSTPRSGRQSGRWSCSWAATRPRSWKSPQSWHACPGRSLWVSPRSCSSGGPT